MKRFFIYLIVFFLYFNLSAAMCLNDIVNGFPEGDRNSIEESVISGACYYLSSQSSASLFLMVYEKPVNDSFEISTALNHIDFAISQLEKSLEFYLKALDTGERSGLIELKIQPFKSFNYENFIQVNHLNNEIANKVKKYFIKGDILGLYNQNIQNIKAILDTLYSLQKTLKTAITPDLTVAWKLLQQYSEATLFGNYSTIIARRVFKLK